MRWLSERVRVEGTIVAEVGISISVIDGSIIMQLH